MRKSYRSSPIGGWKNNTYYIVDVQFSQTNPIHRKIFYSGYITNEIPGAYNFFASSENPLKYTDTFYLEVIKEIGDLDD